MPPPNEIAEGPAIEMSGTGRTLAAGARRKAFVQAGVSGQLVMAVTVSNACPVGS